MPLTAQQLSLLNFQPQEGQEAPAIDPALIARLTTPGAPRSAPSSPREPARAPRPNGYASEAVATKLERRLAKMREEIAHKRRPGLANTRKRRAEYEQRLNEADRLEKTLRMMEALAQSHRDGTIDPLLAGLQDRATIERLNWYLDGEYPAESYDSGVRAILDKLGVHAENWRHFRDQMKALRDASPQQNAEVALRRLEIAIASKQHWWKGYFPSPPAIVERIMDAARLEDEPLLILEPSAGKGDILRAIPDIHEVHAVEIVPELREFLQTLGANIVGTDIFQYKPQVRYDRILMNPPFDDYAAIDHVRYCYDLLAPGGVLVAVMDAMTSDERSRDSRNRKLREFWEWLDGGRSFWTEELPRGAFLESDRSTGTHTRLMVIERSYWQ